MGALFTKPRLKSIALRNFAGISLLKDVIPQQATQSRTPVSVVDAVISLPVLRDALQQRLREHLRIQKAMPRSEEVESIRRATLGAIAETPALVADAAILYAPIQQLVEARSSAAVLRARDKLIQVVEACHNKVFGELVRNAALAAFRKIGLTAVEVTSTLDTNLRMVAHDESGRTLVTEIDTNPDHEPSIATEALGVCHGASHALLEAFDQALEAEGVRAGVPPSRKKTGGVAQLEAAREFVRRPVRPIQDQSPSRVDSKRTVRTQRVNQRNRLRQGN